MYLVSAKFLELSHHLGNKNKLMPVFLMIF